MYVVQMLVLNIPARPKQGHVQGERMQIAIKNLHQAILLFEILGKLLLGTLELGRTYP